MNESEIEKSVCSYARKNKWLVNKFSSLYNKGMPDRIFFKNNFIFFIEFKANKKKLSVIQKEVIKKLKKNKFNVFVIRDVCHGKDIIDCMELINNE